MSALSEARRRREVELMSRRNRQANCALDFLVYGESGAVLDESGKLAGGTHASRCVFGPDDSCSRDYDPYPYRGDAAAVPYPERMYAGTGIGALYGLADQTPDLAGWNIVDRGYEPMLLDTMVSLDALEDDVDEDEHYDEPGPLGADWL